ncbi:hypothetical protein PRIPAC_74913, partial [Pristionchus pacificus]|uniref:Reverse transcriptase domain-containing protein n=1 Tax=Pristionchus pacificus TaxID=54126 RepID=A0A2A6C9A9_PRIPA
MDARAHDAAKSPSGPHKKQTTYKILVIGDPGTGKSSIIRRYVHNVFTANYKATSWTPELPSVIEAEGCKGFTFADDLTIFLGFQKNELSAPKRLQQCINAILKWSGTWQLSIASEKCNVLHIGKGNPKADYFLNTSKSEPKSSIRDLGSQIDDELSFKDHFDIVTQKAATRANIIFRGLTRNDAKVMVNAYTSYVRPMVEFWPSVAFPVHEKEAGKLEKLQNKERNEMLNLKSLTYRRKINDFKHAYELLFGNSRLSRNQAHFLTLSKSNLRGAGYKVCKDPFKTKVREKSSANRISKVLYDVLRKGKIPTKYSEFMSVMSKEIGVDFALKILPLDTERVVHLQMWDIS